DRIRQVQVDRTDMQLRLGEDDVPAEAGHERARAAGRVGGADGGDVERDEPAAGRVARAGGDERRGEEQTALHSFTSTGNSTMRGAPAVKWRAIVSVGWSWLWKSDA